MSCPMKNNMPKFLILQQLQQIKELVLTSFNGQEVDALSLQEHLALILQRGDIQHIADGEQQQLLAIVKRLFPKWTIQPVLPEPPEKVNIAYTLRVLDVARSTFYRSIDKKLLKRSGMIGGRPVYLKDDVDWLGMEAKRLGNGGWVYSKLWERKKRSGEP